MFDDQLDAFLAEEGALAWVRMSYRDAGLVTGEGYSHRVGLTPKLPGVELAAEDYRQLARLTRTDAVPTIEIISNVQYHDEDTKAYNVIADIPGRDPKAGYVMAGAHLDSWVAADGAQDNAAGSAVVMEAARILSKLGIKPKRTIRFALWSGEEQVLGGSLAYIEQHLATRAPSTDPIANDATSLLRLAEPVADHAEPGLLRPGGLLQRRQRVGEDARDLCRGQSRGRADLSRMVRALREHGRSDDFRPAHGRHGP